MIQIQESIILFMTGCIDNGVVPPDRNDEIKIMEDGSVRRRNRLLVEITGKLGYMKDEDIRSLLTNRITSEEITWNI